MNTMLILATMVLAIWVVSLLLRWVSTDAFVARIDSLEVSEAAVPWSGLSGMLAFIGSLSWPNRLVLKNSIRRRYGAATRNSYLSPFNMYDLVVERMRTCKSEIATKDHE